MSNSQDRLSCPYRNSGSVLFFSLWTLVILLIFAVAIGSRVAGEITFARVLKERVISLHLANGCVIRALLELEKDEAPEYDTLYELRKERKVEPGEGSFDFNFLDEESLININSAPQVRLERLPGMNPDLAKEVFESELKPFQLKEELLLVEGITPEIFNGLKDLITVYGNGRVNINTAPEATLQVLGLEQDLIDIILNYRKGDDQIEATEDDREFTSSANILSDLRAFTILTTAHELKLVELLSSNSLGVSSQGLRINISTRLIEKPLRNFSVVLDRSSGKIKLWQEK